MTDISVIIPSGDDELHVGRGLYALVIGLFCGRWALMGVVV